MKANRTSILDTAASTVLVAIGSSLAATSLFFVLNRDVYVAGVARTLLFVAVPAMLAVAAFAAAPSRRRRTISLIALVLIGSLYGGELGLSYANWLNWSAVLRESDPRSKVEALEDLRLSGHDAWPIASPASLMESRAAQAVPADRAVPVPLGGISHVTSIYCGEGRPFVTYPSDRYGFFNPDSAYDENPTLMLLGDSYIQGHCVATRDGIAPRLREQFPGTLNFGMSGNGPLLMLATLREYGPALEPEFVVWSFFSGNDFLDLERERDLAPLVAYLDPDHRYGLPKTQARIDGFLRGYIDAKQIIAPRKPIAETEGMRASVGKKLLPVLSLHNLLPFLGLPTGRINFDYALLEEILIAAQAEVAGWSGRLIFAYLPITADLYGLSRFNAVGSYARQRTLDIARNLGIPIVDVYPAIAALADPMAISDTPRTHYNKLGYDLVAREIAAAVKRREED